MSSDFRLLAPHQDKDEDVEYVQNMERQKVIHVYIDRHAVCLFGVLRKKKV